MKQALSILVVCFLIVGCKGNSQPAVYDSEGKSVSQTPAGNTPGGSATPTTAAGPKESEVPAAFKTAAYEYFGCGNETTMDVELRVKDMPTKTGGVTMKLTKLDAKEATYAIERTGAVADDLGNETVVVDATGVYTTENSAAKTTPAKNLVLPADLSPGKTWASATKVVRNDGQELEEKSTFKVVGEQSVTTKAGTQKALLVTSSGVAFVKIAGAKKQAKYETKSWYVKGRGPVKLEISLALQGQPANSVVVEQTK